VHDRAPWGTIVRPQNKTKNENWAISFVLTLNEISTNEREIEPFRLISFWIGYRVLKKNVEK